MLKEVKLACAAALDCVAQLLAQAMLYWQALQAQALHANLLVLRTRGFQQQADLLVGAAVSQGASAALLAECSSCQEAWGRHTILGR